MNIKNLFLLIVLSFFTASCSDNNPNTPYNELLDYSSPVSTAKLVFIHHSTGYNWLESDYGNLGLNLNAANFYVTECYYGWNAGAVPDGCGDTQIGDRTDTPDWPCWFNNTVMPYVYSNTSNYAYTNNIYNPPAANEIIMFKSCYPMSEVGEFITDEKAIYNSLLTYFASNTNKLFILIIPPPMQNISHPEKTRELANWLADRNTGWLKDYSFGNVYAYDYYNVLTHPDNHHRINGGYEEHSVNNPQNTLYYPTNSGDDHPNAAGQQKATSEFVPLLKGWYNKWKSL